MKKALKPVSRRIRCQHGLTGLCWGLLAALALAAAVMGLSFLFPMKDRNALLLACAAALPLGGIIGLLWPVSAMQAAMMIFSVALTIFAMRFHLRFP